MLNKLKQIFILIVGIRVLQHFLFWLLSFRILLGIFSITNEILLIDYIYTGVFTFTIVIPVYFNLRLLIPKLLSQNKYIAFSFAFIVVLIFSVLFNYLCYSYIIDYIFPEYYFISYYELVDLTKFILVFMLLTTLLKLSKSWFFVSEARNKLALLETEKYMTELQALKSQINPHFMFNSLNNIYSLILSKSAKAPDAVIKLGNIMRYVIYDGSKDKVLLKDEVKILEEYIDLQNLRTKNAAITFTTDIQNDDLEISPLIFLPILENGYKHGIKGDVKGAFLNVNLSYKNNTLSFRAVNNKGVSERIEKNEQKGIGLKNLKRRLELIYPERHEFLIFEEADRFVVDIQIQYGKKN